MNVHISERWRSFLSKELAEEYFASLKEFVEKEYHTQTCYPEVENIFAAFNNCPFDQLKVVIIGQDPYHGPNQANGLSFSVNQGIKHPPSLVNIFKELEGDVAKPYPESGDLSHWATQGVLLLNATLTVRSGQAGSHQKQGWETFTDAVIQKLSEDTEGLVFLLWGAYAKKKGRKIDQTKHKVLLSGHPSPLSANRGYWFGNRHFSQVNNYLKTRSLQEINW